jgi:hypothetical protein
MKISPKKIRDDWKLHWGKQVKATICKCFLIPWQMGGHFSPSLYSSCLLLKIFQYFIRALHSKEGRL